MLIINSMCKLLTAMLAGYYMEKKGVLNKEINEKISSLIVRVTCPFLIITSVSAAEGVERAEVFGFLFIGILIYLLSPILAALLIRLLRLPLKARGVYQCMLIFANCIFMGIPVCQSFFGDEAVFYVSVLHLPYNLLFFSYGIWLLSRDGGNNLRLSVRQLLNPGVVSALIALILFLGDIRLPEVVLVSLSFIGSVTTPLSMMVIGSGIAVYSIGEIFRDKSLYLISSLRLLVIPLIVYLLMQAFTDNQLLIQLVTITAGMPAGSMIVMGASEYQGDVKTASFGVAMTTVCSILTIPLMAFLIGIT